MMIKIILSAGLLSVLAYLLAAEAAGRLLRILAAGTVILGLYFVWFPDDATTVANVLGVGRGADLVLYCWFVVSLILIVNLHVKLRHFDRRLTELVRAIALQAASAPASRVASRQMASTSPDSGELSE